MLRRLSVPLLLLGAMLPGTGAVAAQTAAKPEGQRINVYQYAIDNPVEDSHLKNAPILGASVPEAIALAPCQDEKAYAYFYYQGQPVIVDRSTRSVVRIGQGR
ncbi:hypothetical protein GCM10011390_46410 [Aureimonas endophytica]|uniref:DUF1236 domain-containing protein n=1 Tax=Aureimonas endophytica TaxID=2027858 RepID=A0A917EBQ1_9HYPH|nr:DUF1236 domain-containing protein [Aureimonas endophytica]GGE21768.1 hypothetical protein GCM10011390_46410 [Aureimonas endophytica]